MQTAKAQSDRQLAQPSLMAKFWRFPLVAMAVALVCAFFAVRIPSELLRDYLPRSLNSDLALVIAALATILPLFLVYKLVIAKLGRTRKDDLPAKGAFGDTLLGLFVGIALISVVVGIATISSAYRIVGEGNWVDFLAIVLMTGVVAGFIEEVVVRGIIFRWLEEFGGSLFALVATGIVFGLGHLANENASLQSSVAVALGTGVLLCGAYMLTRSLWLAIGIHAGWNVAQGFIWGVPVSGYAFQGVFQAETYGPLWLSGGAFGLQASVIAVVVGLAAGLWTVWQAKREGHWVRPMWSRNADSNSQYIAAGDDAVVEDLVADSSGANDAGVDHETADDASSNKRLSGSKRGANAAQDQNDRGYRRPKYAA